MRIHGQIVQDYMPRPAIQSLDIGRYAIAEVGHYMSELRYGFLKDSHGNRLLFHKRERCTPYVERISGTLDVRVVFNGKNHKGGISPSLRRIYYIQKEPRKVSEWFLASDLDAVHEAAMTASRLLQEMWERLPKYTIVLETGKIGDWDACKDSEVMVETNRPSTANRFWNTRSKDLYHDQRLVAMVERKNPDGSVSCDVATTFSELKHFSDILEYPAQMM